MAVYHIPNRRFTLLLVLVAAVVLALAFASFFRGSDHDTSYSSPRIHSSQHYDPDQNLHPANPVPPSLPPANPNTQFDIPSEQTLTGPHIASTLENATAKAELGRAAWKLFHTTFARFPDSPTPDQEVALRAYVYLFARLYPCGECAEHFGAILTKFPPQVSSRSVAAAWGCHVHNQVNESLEKEQFDCSKIGDFYHCGCAEDEDKRTIPPSD